MAIEWDKALGGLALVIGALTGSYSAYKSNQTYKGQKETTKSTESAQANVSTASDTILQKLGDLTANLENLATEVRNNRIEVQNAKTKTEGELRNILSEQGSLTTKLVLIEKAVQGMIQDMLEIKEVKNPRKRKSNVR